MRSRASQGEYAREHSEDCRKETTMPYSPTTWTDGTTALSAEHMNNLETGVQEALTKASGNADMWSYIRDLVYPVGSIYMSATLDTALKVKEKFGGEWEAWGAGRVPVGVGTADGKTFNIGETGGKKDAIIPQHNHTASFSGTAVAAHTHTGPSHTHTLSHTHKFSFTSQQTDIGAASDTNDYLATASEVSAYKGTINGSDSAPYKYLRVPASGSIGKKAVTITSGGAKTKSDLTTQGASTSTTSSAGTGATGSAGGHTPAGTVSVANTGESVTNKNLQPYITCYMYRRVA